VIGLPEGNFVHFIMKMRLHFIVQKLTDGPLWGRSGRRSIAMQRKWRRRCVELSAMEDW